MRNSVLILLLLIISSALMAQYEPSQLPLPVVKRNAITVGFLQGGGSLVGADFEFLVSKQVGLQYWHQGVGESFAQDAVGATFNFRARKYFSAQLGLGIPMRTGPAMPADYEMPPVMLLYSIGIYFPI